jgi:hypothetical protein
LLIKRGQGEITNLAQSKKRKTEEDEAFNEDGSQSDLIRHRPRPVLANDGISEVCVQAHSRCDSDRPTEKTVSGLLACLTTEQHCLLLDPSGLQSAFLTYKLAKRPMQNVARAEMAAVAVTRSFLTSAAHRRYCVSFSQGTCPATGGASHTQVPPVSETMLALTAMMYLQTVRTQVDKAHTSPTLV